MRRIVNRNPDGQYAHACLDCGAAKLFPEKNVVWICKCATPQIFMLPTASRNPAKHMTTRTRPVSPPASPPPRRKRRFKFFTPPCAYLGPETGEPLKVGCGVGLMKRARECWHPDREQVVDKKTGEKLPNLAADGWWCGDLGPPTAPFPTVHKACQHCPLRTPQKQLPAPTAPPEGPGWAQKALNLATAYAKHVAAGLPEASDADVDKRYEGCYTCPFYAHLAEGQGECRKCGCIVGDSQTDGLNKLRLPTEECPLPEPDKRWKRLL
jgi:hypothetical protein